MYSFSFLFSKFVIFPFIFNEEFVDNNILRRKKQYTFCRFSITAGSSRFLIIIFYTLRHIIMKHISYI